MMGRCDPVVVFAVFVVVVWIACSPFSNILYIQLEKKGAIYIY